MMSTPPPGRGGKAIEGITQGLIVYPPLKPPWAKSMITRHPFQPENIRTQSSIREMIPKRRSKEKTVASTYTFIIDVAITSAKTKEIGPLGPALELSSMPTKSQLGDK